MLGHEEWTCSNGFLYRFCLKYNVLSKKITGESLDCDMPKYNEFLDKVLPTLLEEYEPHNIYNLDETALFYKALANRTYAFRNEDVRGSKATQSKDRLSLMLCVNMTGTDKLRPLLIGKSQNPACLKKKKVQLSDLKVDYYNNKKGWMTGVIFDHWLKQWNKTLCNQRRYVAVVIDNAPSHVYSEHSNIKVVCLPPNTTSKSQPLDQGVLRICKLAYRTRLTEQYLDGIETMDDVRTVLKGFDFVVACENIVKAWATVKPAFIEKCFRKAGFVPPTYTPPEVEEADDPEPAPARNIWENLQRVLDVNTTFEEYALADDQFETARPMTDEDIVEAVRQDETEVLNPEDDDEDDSDTESDPTTPTPGTSSTAADESEVIHNTNDCLRAIDQMKAFALRNKLPTEELDNFQRHVVANRIKSCTRQSTIFSFINR